MSIIHRQNAPRETDPAAAAAAELEAVRIRGEIQRQRDRDKRARRDERKADRRRGRDQARVDRKAAAAALWAGTRDYSPLLIVNAAAVFGQFQWAMTDIAGDDWALGGKIALAALIAGGAESIAITVGWYAHDALLNKWTSTAARLRRGSYAIAAIIGGINYWHFAGEGLKPTPAAVLFAICSIMSPILWGLRSRRAHRLQLRDEGVVDCLGAVFSAERFRAFPIRTVKARRWSIEHNVTDPVAAWVGYNAERDARRTSRPVKSGRAQVDPSRVQSGRPQSGQVDPSQSTTVGQQSTPVESGNGRPQSGDRPNRAKSAPPHKSADRPVWATSDNPEYLAAAGRVDSDHVAAIVAWYRTNGAQGRITPDRVQQVTGITGAYPKRATRDAAIYALNGSHNA